MEVNKKESAGRFSQCPSSVRLSGGYGEIAWYVQQFNSIRGLILSDHENKCAYWRLPVCLKLNWRQKNKAPLFFYWGSAKNLVWFYCALCPPWWNVPFFPVITGSEWKSFQWGHRPQQNIFFSVKWYIVRTSVWLLSLSLTSCPSGDCFLCFLS